MRDWLTSSSCSGRRASVRTRCRSAAGCGRRFQRRSPTNLPVNARGPWANLSAGGCEEFWRLEWESIVCFVKVAVDSTRTRLANARFGNLSPDAAFYTYTVQANKAKQNIRLVQRTVRAQV